MELMLFEIITCGAPVIVFILQLHELRSSDKTKKIKAIIAIIFVIIVALGQLGIAHQQDIDNKTLQNNYTTINKKTIKITLELERAKKERATATDKLNDIELAIKKANFSYDSANKKLISVKSQFSMPNATFNGPVQQGNGNTQNN